jgi:hypothetical protein
MWTKSRIRSLFNIRKVKKNPSASPRTSPVGGAWNNFCSQWPTKSPGAPGRFGERQARGHREPRWEEDLHVSGKGWWLCRLETAAVVGTMGASSTRGGRDDGTTGVSSSFQRRWTWRRGTVVEPPLTGPLAGDEERRRHKSNPGRHGWEEWGGWGENATCHSGRALPVNRLFYIEWHFSINNCNY